MKRTFTVLLVAALAGCATSNTGLSSLEGKPRVKINTAAPVVMTAAAVAATPKVTVPQPDSWEILATDLTLQNTLARWGKLANWEVNRLLKYSAGKRNSLPW